MKFYSYILLDWDGTVAHTLDLWPDALHDALQKRGYSLTRKQLIDSTWGFVDYVTEQTNISPQEASQVMAEASEIVVKRSAHVALFAGVVQTLRALKQNGKHLALITTSERRMIAPALEKHNLTDVFEVIITDDDIKKAERKPHPKPLLLALQKMGGTPGEALMVGDRDKDIVAAHNAGTHSVLFCSPEHQKHYSLQKLIAHNPTYVMSEFKDLIKIAG